jgi:hypothetical protein
MSKLSQALAYAALAGLGGLLWASTSIHPWPHIYLTLGFIAVIAIWYAIERWTEWIASRD